MCRKFLDNKDCVTITGCFTVHKREKREKRTDRNLPLPTWKINCRKIYKIATIGAHAILRKYKPIVEAKHFTKIFVGDR